MKLIFKSDWITKAQKKKFTVVIMQNIQTIGDAAMPKKIWRGLLKDLKSG